jgi:hypothetical protein
MRSLILAVTCAVAAFATPAQAGFQYGFEGITNRKAANTAVGEAQTFLDVNDTGGGLVTFTFSNIGALASSITEIYFDDTGLFVPTIQTIVNGPGVQFSPGAAPSQLPGGSEVGFVATPGLSLDSDKPKTNGVNPGQSVGVVLELVAGKSYSDVIDAMISTDLRIGVQIKGFSSKGRESFVNVPGSPPVVPEPTTAALAGLACLGFMFRRKKKSAK